jgi:hypothetical protein
MRKYLSQKQRNYQRSRDRNKMPVNLDNAEGQRIAKYYYLDPMDGEHFVLNISTRYDL